MLEDLFLDESLQCIVARKSFLEESLLQGDLFWQNHCYKETFFFWKTHCYKEICPKFYNNYLCARPSNAWPLHCSFVGRKLHLTFH